MEKYELSKEWIRTHAMMIKKGYNIALAHKYDINSAKDVLEVLKIIDPTNASEENATTFSRLLSLFEQRLKKKLETKQQTKSKTVN